MKEVLVYINPGDGVYFEVFKNMHAAVVKHPDWIIKEGSGIWTVEINDGKAWPKNIGFMQYAQFHG